MIGLATAVVAALAGAVLAAVAVFDLAVYSRYLVPSESMQPTVHRGNEVSTRPAGKVEPHQIVIVRPPAQAQLPGALVITRVVAVGGQRVSLHDGQLQVNGVPAREPYLAPGALTAHLTATTIPNGSVYVLGDNRENSSGSNYYGPVPVSSIVGRVVDTDAASSAELIVRALIGLAVVALALLLGWRLIHKGRSRSSASTIV